MNRIGSAAHIVALASMFTASACHRSARELPPLPDATAAQKSAWQLAPEDARGGLVVADVGHLIERLRALKVAVESGPATRAWVQKGMARVILELGFDPLDEGAWKAKGLDTSGPLAIFMKSGAAEVVFRASDDKKASATVEAWLKGVTRPPEVDCAQQGPLYRCGTPGWALAADAGHSLSARMDAQLPTALRGMGLVVYAPLDVGTNRDDLGAAGAKYGLHAGYLGMTLAPERFVAQLGVRADVAKQVQPYLVAPAGSSLLGLAHDGYMGGRITFSPDLLWKLANDQLGEAQVQKVLGAAQAASGIDLEKELVHNLTGEVVVAGHRAPRLGPDGKPRTLLERSNAVLVVGMRDDVAAKHLAQRLGELLAGAAASMGESVGAKVVYRVEAGERPVHWFSIDLSGPLAPQFGSSHMELFLTTTPGGLVLGVGKEGVLALRKEAGRSAASFLEQLPLASERAIFERSPFAMWARTGDELAAQTVDVPVSPRLLELSPDIAKVLSELMALGQLLYDGTTSVDVAPTGIDLTYQLTFL